MSYPAGVDPPPPPPPPPRFPLPSPPPPLPWAAATAGNAHRQTTSVAAAANAERDTTHLQPPTPLPPRPSLEQAQQAGRSTHRAPARVRRETTGCRQRDAAVNPSGRSHASGPETLVYLQAAHRTPGGALVGVRDVRSLGCRR